MKKVGIVGAGLLGRLTAFMLSKQGCEVELFEQTDIEPSSTENRAAAFTSAGLLSPVSEMESGGELVYTLGSESIRIWGHISKEVKRITSKDVGLRLEGNLLVAPAAEESFVERFFKKIEYKCLQLSKKDIAKLEPNVDSKLKCWLIPGEGHIDPIVSLEAILLATIKLNPASQKGFRFKTKVDDLGSGWLKAEGQVFNYDLVFDTRGVGAKDLEIRGVRGETILLDPPRTFFINRPIRFFHPRLKVYIVQKIDGKVLIGATEIESNDASPISLQSALDLLTAARFVFPQLSEARIISTDTNVRPATIDNLPFFNIEKKLVRINGLFRHGWLVAPALLKEIFSKLNIPFKIC